MQINQNEVFLVDFGSTTAPNWAQLGTVAELKLDFSQAKLSWDALKWDWLESTPPYTVNCATSLKKLIQSSTMWQNNQRYST